MRYGPNLLEEVLRRTDIVQLVGKRVKLTLSRSGVVVNRLVRLGAAAKAHPEPKK